MALHLHVPLHDAQVQLAADVADKLSQFSTPTFCLGCSYNRPPHVNPEQDVSSPFFQRGVHRCDDLLHRHHLPALYGRG